MKEVMYKRELSEDKKKKFISFQQRLKREGRKINIYRKCSYNLKEERCFKHQTEVDDFLNQIQNKKETNQVYIKRIADTNSGKVVISYITKGSVFAIFRKTLYRISFRQEHVLESTLN